MINLLIDSYIKSPKKMRKRVKVCCIILIAVTVIAVSLFLFYISDTTRIWAGIATAVLVIAFLAVLAVIDHINRNEIELRFSEHNKRLDNLKKILSSFTYESNGFEKNWYSKTKIQYLIDMCEKRIELEKEPRNKSYDFIKIAVFPIISFVACILSENVSVNDALSIAVFALLAVGLWRGIEEIVTFVMSIVLKSTSVDEMENLIMDLNDLLIRDFDDLELTGEHV